MKEIITRLKAEMPPFFKELQKFAIGIAGLGTAILAANSQMPDLHIPQVVNQLAGYMIWGGLVATGVAQLTKK